MIMMDALFNMRGTRLVNARTLRMAVAAVAFRTLCLLVLLAVTAAQLEFQQYTFARPTRADEEFKVFWNVPSFQCHKYGVNFSSASEQWGITQNYQDSFRGDALAILYDPGLFPALLPTTEGESPARRNGGVPQQGDLDLHLARFKDELNKLIPDSRFSGVGVIDFEHWRPVWRQNWMSLAVYKNYSRVVERRRHPRWPKQDIETVAIERFEKGAKEFMLETLLLAKDMRPAAAWGYYGYPFCFNNKPVGRSMPCSKEVIPENNRLKWLFTESTALYPSVYLRSDLSGLTNKDYITSRVEEALRMAKVPTTRNPVYVYMWSKYQDANRFLSKDDLYSSFAVPRRLGADGVVIWGATKDVNSREKCLAMFDYLQNHLGPTVLSVTHTAQSSPQTSIVQLFGK